MRVQEKPDSDASSQLPVPVVNGIAQSLSLQETLLEAMKSPAGRKIIEDVCARAPSIQFNRSQLDSFDPQIRNIWAKPHENQRLASASKRSRRDDNLRRSFAVKPRCAVTTKSVSGDKITLAKCCATGVQGDNKVVIVAHLLPLRTSDFMLKKLELANGVNDFHNVILLTKGIEAAFDDQRVCFIKQDGSFVLQILDPSARIEPIYPGSDCTIGEFEYFPMQSRLDAILPGFVFACADQLCYSM
jgi:hypothetical protein